MAGAFVPTPKALLDIAKAIVPADHPADLCNFLKHCHPLAIARGVARNRDAPAVGLGNLFKPHPHRHWNPTQIEQGQGAAIVQLAPWVQIPRPDAMGADMGIKQAQGRRFAKFPKLFGHTKIGIHRAPPPPEVPFVAAVVNQNAAESIALLGVGRYLCHNPLYLEPTMTSVLQILLMVLDIAKWIILIHIIMSWLINFQVLNLRQSLVAQIWYGLNRLLDPIYNRVRSILPNTPGLDLAPLIALLVIYGLRIVVYNNMYSFS